MPAPDWKLSPFTGWTRAHWEEEADRLLQTAAPRTSPLDDRTTSTWADVARASLLAAFRLAGARGTADEATLARLRIQLALASGPHDLSSGGSGPGSIADAARLAVGLHLTRRRLWNRLHAETRRRVSRRLTEALTDPAARPVGSLNLLGSVVVEEFLSVTGTPHAPSTILRDLDLVERRHLGGGWFRDETGAPMSCAAAGMLHVHLLVWALLAHNGPRAAQAAERTVIHRERLRLFLGDLIHLIDADGAPPQQTPQTAFLELAAPLALAALFDCSPLAPGVTRRAASGILRHQVGIPADIRAPGTFDEAAFALLLLPPTHPIWGVREQPLPAESTDHIRAITHARQLVQSTAADGLVRLHHHGSEGTSRGPATLSVGTSPRLAYSSATVPREDGALPDNQLTLIDAGGTMLHPGPTRPLHFRGFGHAAVAASWHQPRRRIEDDLALPEPGTRIETHVLVHGPYEMRLHAVTAPPGWLVVATGYGIEDRDRSATELDRDWLGARSHSGLTTTLLLVYGFTNSGLDQVGHPAAGDSTVPYAGARHPGGTRLYATCVALTGMHSPTALLPAPLDVVSDGERIEIALPDGTVHSWTLLPRPGRDGALLARTRSAPR